MKKIILTFIWFLIIATSVIAAPLYERQNTFTTPIPTNPVIATDTDKYVNAIIHADNDDTWFANSYGEYAIPMWESTDDSITTTVIIDARDWVMQYNGSSYLTASPCTTANNNCTKEAQTVGGTSFDLMTDTNDYIYLGDTVFDNEVIFRLEAPLGAGYTIVVEYCSANSVITTTCDTWTQVSNLTGVAATSGFSDASCTTDCRLSFDNPSNEAKSTENSIGGRYWVRIKTTSNPTTTAKALFMAYGDADGEAVIRGWNIVPIPTGAQGGGQEARFCDDMVAPVGDSFDGMLMIFSADGKWLWEFNQYHNCDAGSSNVDGSQDIGVAHANAVRKRARTYAASLEESLTWDGSGIDPVNAGGPPYIQYDGYGSVSFCSAVSNGAHTYTRVDYDDVDGDGTFGHAIPFNYSGAAIANDGGYGSYPCLKLLAGTKSDIDANTIYMGAGRRIQINPDYDCTANTPDPSPAADNGWRMSRMICKTMQIYGAIFTEITGANSKNTEAESDYGRTGTAKPWYGITWPSPALPTNIFNTTNLRVLEPICDDPNLCTGNNLVTYLQAPTVLSATDNAGATGGKINLSWTLSATSGVTQQRIYRGTATGVYSSEPVITIADGTTTSIQDSGLTNGTTYYYIIRAYKSPHLSVYSNESSATPTDITLPNDPNVRPKVTRTPQTRTLVTRPKVTR